ncbi:YadA-like family protein [Alkanindiges sp. WGS2144]|uniref:YadA-like family protein n=1 Tax=Alkanindiges sp. WGS2144 TaxID=3366808 RepID=UPI0037513BCE
MGIFNHDDLLLISACIWKPYGCSNIDKGVKVMDMKVGLKLSALAVATMAVGISPAYAVINDDVIAPAYIETPFLIIGPPGVGYIQMGPGTDAQGNPQGHLNVAGTIQAANIQTSTMDVSDAKIHNLEITGQLNGISSINVEHVTADQSIYLIKNGASVFSVDATTDQETGAVSADMQVGGRIASFEIQTGSLEVVNDLKTHNLEITGALNVKDLDVQDTKISNVAAATEAHQAVNLKQLKDADAKTLADAKAHTNSTANALRNEATAESARVDKAIADGDKATLTAANKTTADTAKAIRNEVADADAAVLAEAQDYTFAMVDELTENVADEFATERETREMADEALYNQIEKESDERKDAITTLKNADRKVLADANQYTNQTGITVLQQAKAYTDANAHGSPFIALQTEGGDQYAKAEGKNAIAMGAGSVAQGDQSIAIGIGNQVTGNNSGAIGDPNIVSGNASYVVGNDNTVSGDNTFVLGNNVNTAAKNAVVLGNGSASTRDNTVSVGAAGKERQITHVAAGTADTDATNVKQLKDSNAATLASAKGYTDETAGVLRGEAAIETARVNKAITDNNTAVMAAANTYTDSRVNQVSRKLDNVEKTAYRGVAIALAAQQAVPNIQPGQVAVFGGVGHYEGESAGSLGVVTSFTNRVSASGAFGFSEGGNFGGRVGVSYLFGGN